MLNILIAEVGKEDPDAMRVLPEEQVIIRDEEELELWVNRSQSWP